MKNKVLILGKIPPPIGGLATHVSRLVDQLITRKYGNFQFMDMRKQSLLKILMRIPQFATIHLHTSSPYLQLIVAIFCRLLGNKLILSVHGNWGRFGFTKSAAQKLSAGLSYKVLVQNMFSLEHALKWNRNTALISSFIPPGDIVPFPDSLQSKICAFKSKYNYTFCTNAWNLTFDKQGKEIYGISELVAIFGNNPTCCLLISDPSGNYERFVTKNRKTLPKNVIFITGTHDFCNTLRLSDAFIRNTTTDGDSISIHEALCYNVAVFASACVNRPSGCILFDNIAEVDLRKKLESKVKSENGESKTETDVVSQIIQIYVTSLT